MELPGNDKEHLVIGDGCHLIVHITKHVHFMFRGADAPDDLVGMMKIVVDIQQEILAIDADMHADLETIITKAGQNP
jgi:hypothetical protein